MSGSRRRAVVERGPGGRARPGIARIATIGSTAQIALAVGLQQRDLVVGLVGVARIASSMCQMNRPSPGNCASKPVRWRFSTRKYSLPAPPFFHRRWTRRPLLTSGNECTPLAVTLVTAAQPWLALHQADGCAGTSPPPFHEPPAIRHQLPMPSEVSSVSYRSGNPNSRWPSSWAQTPIFESSGIVR